MADTMPSSVSVGVRPMRATKRSYSSGFSPCSLTSSGVMATSLRIIGVSWFSGISGGAGEGRHQALEQAAPIGAAHEVLDQVFRMGHHAEHVEPVGIDARDGVHGAVSVGIRRDPPLGV